MANGNNQVVDNLALVPLTQTEVVDLNLAALGVITITSSLGGGGDMQKAVFATINPSAGYVDQAITATQVPYSGLTALPGGTILFLRADGTFAAPPGQVYNVVSIGLAGLAPALPASSGFNYYLRGDGSWQPTTGAGGILVAWANLTGVPSTFFPSPHASTHITIGQDIIPPASTTKPGLVPAVPVSGASAFFLRGDNSWAILPSVSGSNAGLVPAFPGVASEFFSGTGIYSTPVFNLLAGIPSTFPPAIHGAQHVLSGAYPADPIPNFAIGGATPGLVPGSTGGTVNYLRADGTWQAPPGGGGAATSGGAGLMNQLPLTNQTTYYWGGDNQPHLITSLSIAYSQLSGVPVFAGGSAGLVPNSLGGIVNFLRADGVWSAPGGGSLVSTGAAGLVNPIPSSSGTSYYLTGAPAGGAWALISSLSITYSQITPASLPTSFTPSAHAPTHRTGGSDPIGPPTNSNNGLAPILPATNPTLNFLRGDANWAVIPIATATTSGLVPPPPNLQSQWLRGDASFQPIPAVSNLLPGLAPPFPGNTTTFLNGLGQYTTVDFTNGVSGKPTGGYPPFAHASTHITGGSDQIPVFSVVSTGLVPIAGSAGTYLDATGAWSTPAGSGNVASSETIATSGSLIGGGDLSANRTLSLQNDATSPGNSQYYGTNTGGTRGWFASISQPLATATSAGLVAPTGVSGAFYSSAATFSIPPTFTASLPGYVPPSGGVATNFLNASGNWTVPPVPGLATPTSGGIVPSLFASGVQALYFLRGDDTWQLLSSLVWPYSQISGVPVFSGTSTAGLVPGFAPGTATAFLNGSGSFVVPPQAQSATPGYIAGLPSSAATNYWARGDNSWQILPNTFLVSSPWVMPAVGSPVSGVVVSVSAGTGLIAGMTILTGPVGSQVLMEITTVTDSTHLVLTNRGYAINPISGTTVNGSLSYIVGPGVAGSSIGGFVPTPSGVSTQYLSGTGVWTTPAGSGGAGTITTQFSISGTGSVGSPVQLVNDTATPGAFKFYSTNATGTLGWFPLTYSWETSAIFVMPGVTGNVTVALVSNIGVTVGSTVVIEDSNSPPNQAFLEVITVNGDGTHVVLNNRGYTFNSAGGVTFAINAAVTLAGPGIAVGGVPGFVPPTTSNTSSFLRADGTFAQPFNVTTSTAGYVPVADNIAGHFLDSTGLWSTPSVGALAATGTQGAVRGLPASNQSTSVLRGDNTWVLMSTLSAQIAYASLSGLPTTFNPVIHGAQHVATGAYPADPIPNFSTTTTTPGLVVGSNSVGNTFFLRADGTWATTPASPGLATSSGNGLLKQLQASAQTTYFLQGDNTWALISGLPIAYTQLTGSLPIHGSTHLDAAGGGTDTIPVVAGLRTGLVPILPAAAPTTKFLRGDATWTVVPNFATNAVTPGLVIGSNSVSNINFLRADNSWNPIQAVSTSNAGLAPILPASNGSSQWLNGVGSWTTIPFYWTISAGFTQPNANGSVTVTFLSTTGLLQGMVIATVDSGNQTNVYVVASIVGDGTHASLTNIGTTTNTPALSTVNAGQVILNGPPIMTSGSAGIVPFPTGTATTYLDGTGHFTTPSASGSVPTSTTVTGAQSVSGGGALSSNVVLTLTNDTSTPAGFSVYGTNTSGTRGWYASNTFPIATTSNNGLLPALPVSSPSTVFLNGNGVFAAPSSLGQASSTQAGIVPILPSVVSGLESVQWLRADNSWAFMPDSNSTTASWTMPAIGSPVSGVTFNSTANWDVGMTLFFATGAAATCCYMEVTTVTDSTHLVLTNRGYLSNPVVSTSIPTSLAYVVAPGVAQVASSIGYSGLVPTPPNLTYQYLRGDATWAAMPDTWNITTGFTQPAIGSQVSGVVFTSTTNLIAGMTIATSSGTVTNIMSVYSVTDTTHAVLINLGCTGNTTSSSTVNAGSVQLVATPIVSATAAGLVPIPPGNTTTFLNGNGLFSAVAYSSLTGAPAVSVSTTVTTNFNQPAVGTPLNIAVTLSTGLVAGMGVFITSGGYYSITAVPDTTHITIVNSGYPFNVVATTTINSGNTVYISANASLFTSTTAGAVPLSGGGTANFLRADGSWNPIPAAATSVAGVVTPPGGTDQWLRSDATWVQAPPLAKTLATFTWPSSGGSIAVNVDSTAGMTANMALYFPTLGVAEVTVVTDTTHMTIRNNLNTGNAGSTAGVAIGTQIYVGGAGALMTSTTSGVVPNPNSAGATSFLSGAASWLVPSNVSASLPGYVPTAPGNASQFLNGLTGTWTGLPANSPSVVGTVAASPNNVLKFYRGDSTFADLPFQTETNGTFTVPAAGSPVAIVITAASWTVVGQTLWISDGTHQFFAEITIVTDTTHITVNNRGYLGNSTSGTMATAATVSLQSPGLATATQPGFVPTPPNNAYQFLNGQAAWVTPSLSYKVFKAYDNIPFSTTYPSFNTRGAYGLPVLDCLVSVRTDMVFVDAMPLNANLGSGVNVIIHWSAHTAVTGNVVWNVAFARLNATATIASTNFGTANTVTTATTATVDQAVLSTVAVTSANLNSVAAGDAFLIQVTRLGTSGSDTMADTAEVHLVEIRSAGT